MARVKLETSAATDERRDDLDNLQTGAEQPEKKRRGGARRSSVPKKADLLAQLNELKTYRDEHEVFIPLTGTDLAMTTKGLWMVIEGMSGLPFMSVKAELHAGFDDAAAVCVNKYLPGSMAKWVPLMQLGNFAGLIVLDAIQLRKKQVAEKKQTPLNEQPSQAGLN